MAKHRKPKHLNFLVISLPIFAAVLFISGILTIQQIENAKPPIAEPPSIVTTTTIPPIPLPNPITTSLPAHTVFSTSVNTTPHIALSTVNSTGAAVFSPGKTSIPISNKPILPLPPVAIPPNIPANKPLLSLDKGVQLNVPLLLTTLSIDISLGE